MDIVYRGANLKEAEFIGSFVRTDNDCFHVTNVDIAAGYSQSWKSISGTDQVSKLAGWWHTEVGVLLDIAQLLCRWF